MNLRKLVTNSLFLAIGVILHQITPPLVNGMKPDFLLAMIFIIILLNNDYKTILITALAAGIFSAATTSFPGGQLPNIIDKFVTCNILYFVLIPMKKVLNNQFKIILISSLGTILSGSVFLLSALLLVGLPAPLSILFFSIVLPATLINTVVTSFLYNTIVLAQKRMAS
ncbi:MAG: transporter protein [Clostridiaceae bacterium]|jgi:hypothetical protein|nr:transporter protein [Clostridiaceae bacterium]